MAAFPFAPRGYAQCNGQLLPISQNQALFAILGTTYGGDGRTNFALPDLRGRVPVHAGSGPGLETRTLGEKAGSTSVTLSTAQLPVHTHLLGCVSGPGNSETPVGTAWAADAAGGTTVYTSAEPAAHGHLQAIAPAGASQPHNNIQPTFALNFYICLSGVFPSRN
jgi:microcystin-dependent protein